MTKGRTSAACHLAAVLVGAGALVACGSRSWLDVDDLADASTDESLPDVSRDERFEDDGGAGDSSGPDASFDGPMGCNYLTCAGGCCLPSGKCTAPDDSMCGLHGEACEICQADENCKGACVKMIAGGNCNASNCRGCCWGNGYWCSSGVHGIACGQRGGPCSSCIPTQGTGYCSPLDGGGGVCIDAAPPCSPNTCAGCCTRDGICAVGTQAFACGTGGDDCNDCVFMGKQCVAGTCK